MTTAASAGLEARLLILAPIGKDGSLTAAKLATANLPCFVCPDLATLAAEVAKGAAGVLV
nr:hybrid sensor histidine kinase/response regulator [Lautropia sp.]